MSDDAEPPKRRLTPAVWLATGFGVGLVAPAPGTVGALWGLPWAWWLLRTENPWWWLTVPAGILLGVPLCTRAAKDLGGEKDPGAIVWDEIATVPLVFIPVGWLIRDVNGPTIHLEAEGSWEWATLVAIGFVLHRVFDISKPWPCRRLEQLPGGWGIMLDDVVAGFFGSMAMIPCLGLWFYSWLYRG